MSELIIGIISSTVDMIVCIIYYDLLLGKKKTSINNFVWFLAFILSEVALYLNVIISEFINGALLLLISITVSLAVLMLLSLLYPTTLRHRIFTAVTFQVIAMISEIIAFSLLSPLFKALFSTGIDSTLLPFMLSKFVMLILSFFVGVLYKHGRHRVSFKYSIQLLSTPILCLIVVFLMGKYITAENESGLNSIISALICLALALLSLFNYYYLDKELIQRKLEEKQHLLEQHILLQQEKYDQQVSQYKDLRSLIHDTLKQDRFVLSCARENKTQDIITCLESKISNYSDNYYFADTHNLSIDVLVNYCATQCRKNGIKFNSTIRIKPELITVTDYDMNIMLGNIIENALNATETMPHSRSPWIDIFIITDNARLAIRIKNACDISEKKVYYPEESFLNNTGEIHGYGMINTERICTKYEGVSLFEAENNIFTSTVIIPLQK